MVKLKKPGRRALNRSYGGDIPIYLFLLLCGIFMILPMVYAISSSLKPLSEIWIFPPKFLVRNPTFKNYIDMMTVLSDTWVPFSRYVFNTIFVTVVGTGGHLIIGSMCAFALAKYRFKGANLLFNMVVMALMFNATVVQIPNFLIMSKINWIDTYAALIIPAFAYPLGLYLMKQFMEQMIPDSLLEAAQIDGANKWTTFWRIAMPMVKPAWLTLIIFSFQTLWTVGSTIYIQSENMKTLNYALSQIFAGGIARQGSAAAATVSMMIPPIVIFLFSQSNIVTTMATSGMKD